VFTVCIAARSEPLPESFKFVTTVEKVAPAGSGPEAV
jgi:hypothetical protein